MSRTSATSRTAGRGARHALFAVPLVFAALLMPLGAPTARATEDATPAPVLDQTVSSPPDTRTTKDPHIESAPALGCKLDCIMDSFVTKAHGDSAEFKIRTNTPVTLTIEAFPVMGNGGWTWFGPLAASAATNVPTEAWTPTLTGLAPDKEYSFVVRAQDGWGNEQVKSGRFYTPSA